MCTWATRNSAKSRIYGNNPEHFLVHAEDPPGNKKDYDWVKKCATEDGKWIFWSTKRLHLMREVLTRGIPVQYRSSGTSLPPLVKSDDICYIYPIKYGDEIEVGDIVFCSVQSGDRLYVHLVWNKYTEADYYGVDHEVYTVSYTHLTLPTILLV